MTSIGSHLIILEITLRSLQIFFQIKLHIER